MLGGPGAFPRHILPTRLLGSMLGPDLVMLSGVYVVLGVEHVKHTSLSFATLSPAKFLQNAIIQTLWVILHRLCVIICTVAGREKAPTGTHTLYNNRL